MIVTYKAKASGKNVATGDVEGVMKLEDGMTEAQIKRAIRQSDRTLSEVEVVSIRK